MAKHRRVEPRGIIGTGMAADAERIRDVEEDQQRKERAWRNAPERGFGDVLESAPAKAELEEEPHEDPRKKSKAALPTDAPTKAPAPVEMPSKALPKVPRDPRERLLREQLAQAQANPSRSTSSDTPPTGSHARKPVR